MKRHAQMVGRSLTIVLPEEGFRLLGKIRQAWTTTEDDGTGQITIEAPDESLVIFVALQQIQFMREIPLSVSASLSPSPSEEPEEEEEETDAH